MNSMLGRAMMQDLDISHPQVFNFLESVQPYNSGYEWIEHLSKFANEKHVRLTPQKRKETKTLTIGDDVSMTLGEGASLEIGDGASISLGGKTISGGQSISVNSDKILGDTALAAKRETWVSFFLGDTEVNAVQLCNMAVKDGYKIVCKFMSLF
jgi:hypothetical protein